MPIRMRSGRRQPLGEPVEGALDRPAVAVFGEGADNRLPPSEMLAGFAKLAELAVALCEVEVQGRIEGLVTPASAACSSVSRSAAPSALRSQMSSSFTSSCTSAIEWPRAQRCSGSPPSPPMSSHTTASSWRGGKCNCGYLMTSSKLARDNHQQTAQAQRKTQPLPAGNFLLVGGLALTGDPGHPKRGKHGLQTDDQCSKARTHSGFDCNPNAAQIPGMHKHSGDCQMQPLPYSGGPLCPCQGYPDQKADDGQKIANNQKSQRRRIWQAELCNDKAGAPDHHKHGRHRPEQKVCRAGGNRQGTHEKVRKRSISCGYLVRARISGMAFCR